MMRVGSIKRLDTNGRIHLSSEIRDYLQLDEADLNVYIEGDKVIIERLNKAVCHVCAGKFTINFGIVDENSHLICPKCLYRWGKVGIEE